MTMRILIESLFEYLTIWKKDSSQETKKFTTEVFTFKTHFHEKISFI